MPCGLDFVVDSVDILQTMLINKVYTITLPFPEVSEWMYLNRILFNALLSSKHGAMLLSTIIGSLIGVGIAAAMDR